MSDSVLAAAFKPGPGRKSAGCGCAKCRAKNRQQHRPGCRCGACHRKRHPDPRSPMGEEQFIGGALDWISDVFGGVGYETTPGQPFGPFWKSKRPPGLPFFVREAGKLHGALPDVRKAAEAIGLGATFVKAVVRMAEVESGGTYARPANKFDARLKEDRAPGAKAYLSWGVFQFKRDAWTILFSPEERKKRASYYEHHDIAPPGQMGCEVKPGCVLPWDCTPQEEIERPIAKYASLYREVRDAGGSHGDAAGALRLWHITPRQYHVLVRQIKSKSPEAAWKGLSRDMRSRIGTFLKDTGITGSTSAASELEVAWESEVPAWAKGYNKKVQDAIELGAPMWALAVQRAIEGGLRNADKLANLAFYMHFPERNGRKIDKNEPGAAGLIESWKFLRNAASGLLKKISPMKGPLTEVNTPLPRDVPGITPARFGNDQRSETRQHAIPETIQALLDVARRWKAKYPSGPDIQVSDISAKGGGELCFGNGKCHKSHRMGIDADIRLIRKDGAMKAVSYSDARAFDAVRTQALVDIIRSNTVLRPQFILLTNKANINGTKHDSEHTKHIHVRFCMPQKYDLTAMKKAVGLAGVPRNTYMTCS